MQMVHKGSCSLTRNEINCCVLCLLHPVLRMYAAVISFFVFQFVLLHLPEFPCVLHWPFLPQNLDVLILIQKNISCDLYGQVGDSMQVK